MVVGRLPVETTTWRRYRRGTYIRGCLAQSFKPTLRNHPPMKKFIETTLSFIELSARYYVDLCFPDKNEYPTKQDESLHEERIDKMNLLKKAMEEGKVVGVCSAVLGKGIILTGVEDVFEMKGEWIVLLKPFVKNSILRRDYISIDEIDNILPVNFPFSYRRVAAENHEEIRRVAKEIVFYPATAEYSGSVHLPQ